MSLLINFIAMLNYDLQQCDKQLLGHKTMVLDKVQIKQNSAKITNILVSRKRKRLLVINNTSLSHRVKIQIEVTPMVQSGTVENTINKQKTLVQLTDVLHKYKQTYHIRQGTQVKS